MLVILLPLRALGVQENRSRQQKLKIQLLRPKQPILNPGLAIRLLRME
jgi:hypothetical protein